jgi:hypothetical protein
MNKDQPAEALPLTTTVSHGGIVPLIREAMASGRSPEFLRELLAVRREWEADEARKAYNISISEFQRRAPIIEKADKAYDKAYARMDRIWRETRPLVTELGLSVTWQICTLSADGTMCHVEGQLRHRDGHGEKLVQDIPLPEIIKGQNRAQQMGSASTYAKRYAFCAALGIVTGEDDDGHGAGAQFVTYDQAQELATMLDACRGIDGFKEEAFWGWVGAKSTAEIQSSRYPEVKAMLQKKLKGNLT